MKRTFIFGMLFASAAAFAHPGQRDGMRMLFDTLNLTAKQQEQLHAIRKEARDERVKIIDQLDDLRFKTHMRTMAVLTDEQKKTLQTERQAMLQKRMQSGCGYDRMPPRGKMPMQMQMQNP